MYKLFALVSIVLVVGCGGPKQEAPKKPTAVTTPEITITVKTIDSMTVISIEKKGPYAECGKAIGELFSWAMAKKIKPAGAPFGVFYDDPAKVVPESTRYEVCIPVAPGIKGDKVVKVKKLPAMEVASTIYIGPYDKVGPTYEKFFTWLEKNNYMMIGLPREIYISNPAQVPAESLRTEIQFPIKKKM